MLMLMLWSAPRSRSTAFYRMMVERGDFTGVHEPFSQAAVFGDAGVGGRLWATAPQVIAELRSLAATRQVFIKDTTDRRHPEALADRRFLAEDALHTFLIRHPRETIRSYLAIRRNPRIHEIGYEAQYEVYTKVRRLTGRDPVVVDAGDLMKRPADIIRAYCARAGIDFRPHALSWRPSDRPEWQGGFSRWFTDVAASSGLAEVPRRRGLDGDQHPLLGTYLAYHLPFYHELYQRRLVVLGNRGCDGWRSAAGLAPHKCRKTVTFRGRHALKAGLRMPGEAVRNAPGDAARNGGNAMSERRMLNTQRIPHTPSSVTITHRAALRCQAQRDAIVWGVSTGCDLRHMTFPRWCFSTQLPGRAGFRESSASARRS